MSVFEIEDDGITLASANKQQSSYVIPRSIEKIKSGTARDYAFIIAKDISFKISFEPNCKLTSIGAYAFFQCRYLYNIDFTNAVNLRQIVNYAFASCTSLTTLEFPASLEELGYYGTFFGCSLLSKVTFPDESRLITLRGGTFSFTQLKTFRVPKNVKNIYGETFESTPIEEFTLQEGNNEYEVYNGSLYTKGLSSLVCHQKATQLNISKSTTTIANLAFAGYSYDVIIPTHVVNFGNWAFNGFNGNLLVISSPINTITTDMFELGKNVKQLMFFGKIGRFEQNGISGNGLEVISFAAKISNIRKDSFSIDFDKVCFAFNVEPIITALAPTRIKLCTFQILKTCQPPHLRFSLIPKIGIILFLS